MPAPCAGRSAGCDGRGPWRACCRKRGAPVELSWCAFRHSGWIGWRGRSVTQRGAGRAHTRRPWALQEWLGQRLIWWPRGVPPGERVGIVSSRLGSLGKLGRHWFAVLRQLCRDLDAERQVLVTAQGTALDELLGRCARLFHIPLVRFEVPRPGCSPARWSADCRARSATRLGDDAAVWPAVVFATAGRGWPVVRSRRGTRLSWRPVTGWSRAACGAAGKHPPAASNDRLNAARCASDSRVDLIVGSGFVARHIAHELAARGAALRMADAVCRPGSVPAAPAGPVAPEGPGPVGPAAAGAAQPRILTVDQIPLTDYLTHCTRASEGPWPDQDRGEYLDHLILDRPDAVHSALSTLARIVTPSGGCWPPGRAILGGRHARRLLHRCRRRRACSAWRTYRAPPAQVGL